MCQRQVLETARQVASLPVSSTPVSYDQVKDQCEALVTGKQQKMSVLQSFKKQQDCMTIIISGEQETKSLITSNTVRILTRFLNSSLIILITILY